MKLLVFALLVACASAQYYSYPGYWPGNWYGRYLPYALPTANQYHAQDAFGQASYGYSYPGQAATNYRDAFGNQIGSYAYINPEGKEVRVSYVADSKGFRVLSNDLPVAPVDNNKAPVFDLKAPVFDLQAPVFDGKAPEPVKDTPEVEAARAEFFKLYKEAEAAAAAAPESRKKRQILIADNDKFTRDLFYQSVDLNQDGQPDVPVVAAPAVLPYAYPALRTYTAPLAYAAPAPLAYAAPAPLVAKQTVETAVLTKDESAKTPADTNKLDTKIVKQDIYTPLAYPSYYPFAYPALVQAAEPAKAEDEAVKVESSRKKRQVFVTPNRQFTADLLYNSVDLNQDGQPDKAALVAPAYPYYGYSYGLAGWPYGARYYW